MNTNRVSATLSNADQEAVLAAIETIRQKPPFLIDLTTSERVAMTKLGDRSQAFVKKALEVALQNRGRLPVSFDLEEMRRDAQLFENLAAIRLALDKLCNLVDDTTMQAGAEAYAAARAVYAAMKTPHAGPALRTASDDLSKRFRRKRAAPVQPKDSAPPANDSAPPTTADSAAS